MGSCRTTSYTSFLFMGTCRLEQSCFQMNKIKTYQSLKVNLFMVCLVYLVNFVCFVCLVGLSELSFTLSADSAPFWKAGHPGIGTNPVFRGGSGKDGTVQQMPIQGQGKPVQFSGFQAKVSPKADRRSDSFKTISRPLISFAQAHKVHGDHLSFLLPLRGTATKNIPASGRVPC